MRIIITEDEILEAIEKLILDQVDVPDDMRIDIVLKATRGDEGYTAEIDILPPTAPDDGTDRSVDPRIEPVEVADDLGIAKKVLEAKAEAQLPRRRGRPRGARNRPKLTEAENAALAEPHTNYSKEPTQEPQEPVAEAVKTEVVNEPQAEEMPASEAPVEVEPVSESEPEPAKAPEPVEQVETPVELQPEPVAEQVVEQAPAATVTEADVSSQVGEELADSVSDAGVAGDEDMAEKPADPPAGGSPRSLFANLAKPGNADNGAS